jgi:hypothetical protein
MSSKSLSGPEGPRALANDSILRRVAYFAAWLAAMCTTSAAFAAPPDWMRAQVGAALPPHEETDNAVVMYSETVLTVLPNGDMKRLYRVAYKILRPGGEQLGAVRVHYDPQSKITFMRAWSIPGAGKEFEVKERDALETSLFGVLNGELVSDLRTKVLQIPAAIPGSIVGYEVEQELRPYMRVDEWRFQDTLPVRETRYAVHLPNGWSHRATWLNHADQQPVAVGTGKWQWTLSNLKPVRIEKAMPSLRGVAGSMMISVLAPDGRYSGMQSWSDIGAWYLSLTKDRLVSSPQIKAQVAELTASAATPLQKMRALANFVQANIRYVSIQLGIGGYQPDAAVDVFTNRFGDCKDKSTLLSVMLKEIGVESHYVIINTERGAVAATDPASLRFNHVVLAIKLPPGVDDTSLLAQTKHPTFGRLLYFDPTDTLTPFGRIPGGLQDNYGLLVTADGGELIALPKFAPNTSSIDRKAQMTLDASGTLSGDVQEIRVGDPAAMQRDALQSATREIDRIKPVESVVAAAFTSFEIQKAAIANLRDQEKPFEWHYTVQAPNYAKLAGELLLVRPRVLGSKGSGLLETDEPRVHPIEFDRPQLDTDVFEIAIPDGFVIDELPPTVKVDEGFAAYQSKTEAVGKKIRYTRIFEIRELSVPAVKAEKLKQLYRTIANDERNLAVLKRAP